MPLPGARRREARDALPPEVLADVVDTLVACPAFTGVAREDLAALARRSEIAYLAEVADPVTRALVVLRGGLAVRDERDRSADLVGEGEYAALAAGERVAPVESCLVLWLPEAARDLAWSAPADRLPSRLLVRERPATDLRQVPVRRLMRSPVVLADARDSCREAAARMAEQGISSVLVPDGDRLGILTDRDLRARLVARGHGPDTPVAEVATWSVRTVDASTTAFEALLEMVAAGIHHLPVVEAGRVVGMLSSGDLELLESRSPMRVRVAVDRARDVPGVAAALEDLPAGVEALLAGGTPPRETARLVATLTDRVHERLLRLVVAELDDEVGPAPVDLGWVAFGSQARREQTLHTDQDTGLLLPEGLDAGTLEAARAYADRLAARMVAALEECGYPRCPGGVMATEADWCGTVEQWRLRVGRLLRRPSERHLVDSTILFDLRTVWGPLDARALLAPAIGRAADEASFLGHLARAAARHRPPLGFLGRFAVERGGEHTGRFDVKAGAMLPITDLARLATLARGGVEVGTHERLVAAAETGAMSRDLASTLREGYELATGLRLRLHLRQHREGLPRDNFIVPAELDPHERSGLRQAFRGVRTAQEHLASRYLTGMLG